MKIILPDNIEKRLYKAISKAGNKEVGGILMGEHVANNHYRIVDCTIQRNIGTVISFIRNCTEIIKQLKIFFKRTSNNYRKYNYLGEWHSHPQFSVQPSGQDMESMWEIVEDSNTNANFATLLILKAVHSANKLEGSVTIFISGHKYFKGELIRE